MDENGGTCGAWANLVRVGLEGAAWELARRAIAVVAQEPLARERVPADRHEDVIDEALVWAVSNADDAARQGEKPFAAWVAPVVRQLARDERVRSRRARGAAVVAFARDESSGAQRERDDVPRPRRKLPPMTAEERRIVETCALAGSQAEAARRLGFSRARVRACIERVRSRDPASPPRKPRTSRGRSRRLRSPKRAAVSTLRRSSVSTPRGSSTRRSR